LCGAVANGALVLDLPESAIQWPGGALRFASVEPNPSMCFKAFPLGFGGSERSVGHGVLSIIRRRHRREHVPIREALPSNRGVAEHGVLSEVALD
jgi:hypothetical protein